jgi:colanic acid biosynthesis protein WcaH
MKYIPQEDYNKILKIMPLACIDIAIVSHGSILLVKRKDPPAKGEWWVPGGRILKGETMKDCATRKAKEEIGIDCRVGPIIYTAETIFDDGPFGIPVHTINSCFLMYPKTIEFACHIDSHHEDYRWFDKVNKKLNIYVQNCLLNVGLNY